MTQRDIDKLQATLVDLKRQSAEADGATKQLLGQLAELGYDSVEVAEQAVESLNSEQEQLAKEFESGMEAFTQEYQERLQ
jgi:phage shock protein A